MSDENKKEIYQDRFKFSDIEESSNDEEIYSSIDRFNIENQNENNSIAEDRFKISDVEINLGDETSDNIEVEEATLEEDNNYEEETSNDEVEENTDSEEISEDEEVSENEVEEDTNLEEDNNYEEETSNDEVEESTDSEDKVEDTEEDIEDSISIVDSPDTVNVSDFKSVEKSVDIEEKKETNNDVIENKIDSKPHVGFETRMILLIVFIIVFFVGAIFLAYEALNHNSSAVVNYDEVSDVTYQVCPKDTAGSCLNEGLKYDATKVNTITAKFNYNAKFSEDIDYNAAYHVAVITKIYNKYDNSKILYNDEKTIVKRTNVSNGNKTININKDVTINYNDYNKVAKDYDGKYVEYAESSVEVVLYLDEKVETRKVSSITIPLNTATPAFSIGKYTISNKDRNVHVEGKTWDTYNTVCAIIASVLIIISLILVYKATSLVSKVIGNRNEYQRKLDQILNEYDRIIVVARNGYESNEEKEIVKLASFDELLDVKDNLNKPIIYSKINDVKSEFIVDDDNKLYKYIMKESD